MLRRAFFVVLFLVVLAPGAAFSQQPTDSVYYVDSLVPSLMRIEHKPFRAGVSLSYGINYFDSVGRLPDSLLEGCDSYRTGEGRSIQGGLHIEYPMWGDVSPLSFLLGLGYRNTAGTMTYSVDSSYPVQGGGFEPVRMEIRHRSIGISASPGFVIEPFKQLRFTIQPELQYFFYKRYDKKLFLETPASYFINCDQCREKDFGAGPTPEARSFNAALRSTIGYEVPLSKVLYAEPQIGLTIPLLGVTPSWYAWRIDAGISIHYDLTPRLETIPVYNTIKVPVYVERNDEPVKPKLTASISAIGINRDGVESPVLHMAVEEVRSRNAYPVLTYLFFDENSARIPQRYIQYSSPQQAQREFKGSELRENIKPLELYHEVLNVLGSRLKANRNAKVRLVGTISNAGAEAGKLDIARARADAVKSYLTSVWSIAPNRITAEAKLDPEKPSPNSTELGREENRRVEIIISDDVVTDPVTVMNTERLATPDRVRLIPSIEADTGEVKIKSIKASVLSGDRELITFSGDAKRFANTKSWSVTEQDILQFKDSLQLRLDISDEAGNTYVALGSLPISVAQNTTDKPERLERFSLILFDFDESRIESKNERMIQRVASALPKLQAERITIVGHTDETGTEEYNDRLSRTRAEAARLALERAAATAGIKLPARILSDGLGARERLFDNSLPEGRFYSRTVNITVEKRR